MNNYTVISNNVKGLQSAKREFKLIHHLKDTINENAIIFLQETHSSVDGESKQKDNFQGDLFYSHGLSIYCGVLIGLFGFESIKAKTQLYRGY